MDGLVLERNLGERSHSKLQKLLTLYFGTRERELGDHGLDRMAGTSKAHALPHSRCVYRARAGAGRTGSDQPSVCLFEILSSEDRLSEMEERVADYLAFGVAYVWIIDPERQKIYRSEAGRRTEVVQIETDLFTIGPEILFPS